MTPIWGRRKALQYFSLLRGLGFDYSTSEHKVIDGQYYKDDGIVFSVYTLQTDSWRKIEYLFPYKGKASASDGIVVHGAIHWLSRKLADGELVIISFLLEEEKVEEIELPPNATGLRLGAFRNSLCLTSFSDSETYIEFWVMKEYGVRESWTKIKVSKPYNKLSHSGFWTETHDLMVFDMSSLVMYNFEDGTSWNLPIGDLDEDCFFGSVGVYVECLPSKVETMFTIGR
ncbi:PREDICTED: F-box/kelch-repeat protein At3g06240-like [Fragaria vesca subsp. vesca]|uniref:F-box/kelch-repeat protein At3g06240-like n=1 Tax=Fragaria vesca subsp. vesca TaxID=101020 RepID=UPI0002C36E47|nr:PREDICTED: F-box/kelch-repeat protein At3g06240-like [Fragaria vesca subsp. vesca]